MGAPTTANYVITSTIAAPALLKLGVPALAAHMFAFYFGIIADITPPVALAAFAGAAIAKANPFRTGLIASKLAIAAFLVPYIFVYNPVLLLIDATLLGIVQMILTSIIGMIGIGAAVEGWYWTRAVWWERTALFVGGILLVDPRTLTDIAGLVIIVLITIVQYLKWRTARLAKTKVIEGSP
jgi:TRAP-type uncharacterized transport system fused permease subunit